MKNIVKNWNAVRLIRLLFSIGFGIYAISIAQYLFLAITIFLLLQVIFYNTLGYCCRAKSYDVNIPINYD